MTPFASLAAKIATPVVVLAAVGAGFLLWQGGESGQVSAPTGLAQVAATSPVAEPMPVVDPVAEEKIASDVAMAKKVSDAAAEQKEKEKEIENITETPKVAEKPKAPEPPKPPQTAEIAKAPEPKAPTPDAPFKFDPAWRDAVVNVYCYWPYGDTGFSSGSGVIIDPRGVILTNAHVAAEFLYYDTPQKSLVDCVVRINSPSEPRYRAKLLHLPEQWITDDLATIGKYVPYEDLTPGRADYALLYITKTTDPNGTLPATFPYLPPDTGPLPLPGSHTYMVGYPGSFVGSDIVLKGLTQFASPAIVDSLRSIKGSATLDVVAFKGVTSGQYGASGGAVITAGGKLVGMPSFFDEEGQGASTADATTNVLTVDYVSRDLKADTGFSLSEFIAHDTLENIAAKFLKEKAPVFHKQYVDAYAKMNTKGTIFIVPGGY